MQPEIITMKPNPSQLPPMPDFSCFCLLHYKLLRIMTVFSTHAFCNGESINNWLIAIMLVDSYGNSAVCFIKAILQLFYHPIITTGES